MKLVIKEVAVTINEKEALSIINAIHKGIGNMPYAPDMDGANNLLQLLNGNFHTAKRGIHFPGRE